MNNNLSENLKKIRKDNNMSQEQLAEELKVSRQAISKWESGIAYPEMEKILQICSLFELNINDLLNNDIREVKKEEESKNSINKYIDDFLKFITNSINMFSTMSFKSKIKCMFEQIIIIGILALISTIIGSVLSSVCNEILFHSLSYNVYQVLHGIFKSIYLILIIIVDGIVVIHIFKTRYLDYYNNLKISSANTEEHETEVKQKTDISKTKDERIVIRDPRHSEYKFINGLLKFIVGCIKCFIFLIFLFFAFVLIGLMALFVSTFLVSETGIFFIGLILALLSVSIILIIFELVFLNFIFNRKTDKKKIICTFIIGIVAMGIGVGMICLGTLNFKVIPYDESNLLKIESKEIEMQDNLFFNSYSGSIEFVEKQINNIKIEYPLNKYSGLKCEKYDEYGYTQIFIYSDATNVFEMMKEYFNYINDMKIINLDGEVVNIKIYASKENISKLKKNYQEYITKQQSNLN